MSCPPSRRRDPGPYLLLAIPPDGRAPFVLLSPVTEKPIEIEFGLAWAERIAARESRRLAATGFRFEVRAA